MTPGMGIGVATPGAVVPLPGVPENAIANPASPLDKRASQISRPSHDQDYFGSGIISAVDPNAKTTTTTSQAEQVPVKDETPKTPADEKKEKDTGKSPTAFGKKFRMGMSFGSKKIGRSASTTKEEKPVIEEKPEEDKSESSSSHEKEVDDSFFGVIQKIRNDYEKQLIDAPEKFLETKITPSLSNETPVLKLPSGTRVIIQEETSGGSADLYRGTVETVGVDSDAIEHKAPMWLGEVLLLVSIPPARPPSEHAYTNVYIQNTVPIKDPVKVSFVLYPWQDTLPSIATADGNNRLNANRMLRVKKILAYVAERIDPSPEEPDADALKPEEYLELYCNDQVSIELRLHFWPPALTNIKQSAPSKRDESSHLASTYLEGR